MKRNVLVLAFIFIVLNIFTFCYGTGDIEYRQGVVLVRFMSTQSGQLGLSQRTDLLNNLLAGATAEKSYCSVSGLTLVNLPDGVSVSSAISQLQQSPIIMYAEPDYIYRAALIPNDPRFNEQWALNNTGQMHPTDATDPFRLGIPEAGTLDADIDAPEAWDYHFGNPNIVVGVVDTGIDYNHPDLIGNLWVNFGEIPDNGLDDDGNGYVDDYYGWNAIEDNGDPMDDNFHGTHCAGIIGAQGFNGIGISGVCWNTSIMSLKFLDVNGVGATSDAIECLEYARQNGANVLNNSWGSYGYSQALYDAIADLKDDGILFVASAGNDYFDNDIFPSYPASYDLENIISVLATDDDDQLAFLGYWGSNYGLNSVDIGAPGVDILSTFPTYDTNEMNDYNLSTFYETISGTSMAAPHVAGAVAFIWSFVPPLDYETVRDVILFSADPLPQLDGLCSTGARLNLYSALNAISGRVLNKDTLLEYNRIQDAIDDPLTLDGHTIIVHKGPDYLEQLYYFEAIDFKGKAVTVRSGNVNNPGDDTIYPERVVISARVQNTHTVSFVSGEGPDSVLKGFTIADGYATGAALEDKYGGGIYLEGTSPVIMDCIITNNRSYLEGGGIYCNIDANPTIMNCTISNNTSGLSSGGGIYCFDSSPLIKNCLIIDNKAYNDGAGVFYDGYSTSEGQPQLLNSTIEGNRANVSTGLGGAIYTYWGAQPEITDCIISNNNGYAIYEDVDEDGHDSVPQITYCLFYDNPDGHYFDFNDDVPLDSEVLTDVSQINALPESSDNFEGDPLFVPGRLGEHYLSHTAAGQMDDSIAIDAGSDTAVNLDMDSYSTRTDNVDDTGLVDVGFHYNDPCAPVMFTLTTSVSPIGKGSIDPPTGAHLYPQYAQVELTATASDDDYWFKAWHGTDDDSKKTLTPDYEPFSPQLNVVTMDSDKDVLAEFEKVNVRLTVTVTTENGSVVKDPAPTRLYYYRRGTVVTMTVTPDNPSDRITWTGSDDDASHQLVNTVTMTEDKDVQVELRNPRTLVVGAGGDPDAYTNVGDALRDSLDGDTVVIHEGVWDITWYNDSWLISGKDITIRSVDPSDPAVVANTVLQSRLLFEDVTRDMVVAGITFRDFGLVAGNGADGTAQNTDCDGGDGGDIYGAGLQIGASNISVPLFPDLLPLVEASPTFINCVFDNITAQAGDGGNNGCGCPQNDPNTLDNNGGWAGRAYGGAIYVGIGCKPLFKNCTISNCQAVGGDSGNGCYYPGSWGNKEPDLLLDGWYWFFEPYDDIWHYTGMGGGAYCDVNSAPEFVDCNFIDNLALGGSIGLSSLAGWPHWRIDSYGGAVFCAAASTPEFTSCRFIDNTTNPGDGSVYLWKDNNFDHSGGDNVSIADKYFAYGGAFAIEGKRDTYDGYPYPAGYSKPIFENCIFEDNLLENGNGGSIYIGNAETILDNCEFTNNLAYHGGAIYAVDSNVTAYQSTFMNNDANSDLGQGGAITMYSDGELTMLDCNAVDNTAVTSGGAFYFSDSNAYFWNTIIRDNEAGRDGGAISANLYSDCNIVNCTLINNLGGNYGGGIYSTHNSFVRILDSIVWGNMAANGHQLAVAEDDPYNPEPSVVEVFHSLIGPKYGYLAYGFDDNSSVFGSQSGFLKLVDSNDIYEDIGSSGSANVIITLSEPVSMKNEVNWNDSYSVESLQTEIYNRQQAVLSTLNADEFTLKYRYDNIAAFSGEVTQSGLDKLLSNSQALHIEPVRHFCYQMSQSLALANALGYRATYGGDGVGIAICDSGFDYRHPDLGADGFPNSRIVGGYDFASDDDDPQQEGEPHGTATAGIAAGSLNSVSGYDYIGGVAYEAGIYAMKISVGTGGPDSDAALAAWDWCITHKNDNPDYPIMVISNSWGSVVLYDDPELAAVDYPALDSAANTAVAAGITVLAASGNDGFVAGIAAPAALENVISVGAVYDTTGQVANYSDTADILDILAPGSFIDTTDVIGLAGYSSDNYYAGFEGTSASCPFAAGAVCVLQEAAMDIIGQYLTPQQVRRALIASGNLVTDPRVNVTKPRLNVGKAIDLLTASPIYLEENCDIRYGWWYADTQTWDTNSYNLSIDTDPNFVDGYYLSQLAAGQDIDSPAVDAGSRDAHSAGMYRHTTRTDLVVEDLDSIVDLGYHYIRTSQFPGDLDFNGFVNFDDIALRLLRHWLNDDCQFPDFCHGTDINKDGIVNNKDYAIIAANYPSQENIPPEPDPMTWKIYPRSSAGAAWAFMEATKAFDEYGGIIMYQIQRFNPNGSDLIVRDWDTERTFTNTGLTINKTYGYNVRARDARGNITDWSLIGYVEVGKESVPFQPSSLEALGISENQIALVWLDNADNETGFKIERFTGTDEFEQIATVGANVTEYTDGGLEPSTGYTYRVRAYNVAGNSDYSNMASATTFTGIPEPNAPVIFTPPDDDPNSYQYFDGPFWHHSIVADISDFGGDSPVWFRFECISAPTLSTGWISDADTFPLLLPHPINASYPDVEITVNGTQVTCDIIVKEGGTHGWSLMWRVCASYTENGQNKACSQSVLVSSLE